jgi:hypothetical protein
VARAVERLDRWGGTDGAVVLIFQGPECWRCVRRPHAEHVAVDAATAATHRWTGSARGRGVGPEGGNGQHESSLCFSGGPSGGGAFVAHTLKSSPSTPPPPPLIGGQAARAVEGLDRWGNGRSVAAGSSWCFRKNAIAPSINSIKLRKYLSG